MGAVHQSGDSAVNKTIRPLPSNGSTRSIISAGLGDGCRNVVIDGSVHPSNLSADKEGLNNHERNEDRRPRLRTLPVPHWHKSQLKFRKFGRELKVKSDVNRSQLLCNVFQMLSSPVASVSPER